MSSSPSHTILIFNHMRRTVSLMLFLEIFFNIIFYRDYLLSQICLMLLTHTNVHSPHLIQVFFFDFLHFFILPVKVESEKEEVVCYYYFFMLLQHKREQKNCEEEEGSECYLNIKQ